MKKITIVLLAALLLLTACASQSTSAASTPTALVYATPDTRPATATVGSASLPKDGVRKSLFLLSRPDPKAPPSGQIFAGDSGTIVGIDATGRWVLVEFKDQSGWASITELSIIIAN
jgi:hypothetical protein